MNRIIGILVLLFAATTAHAENGVLPMASKPEEVGLSSTQLKRLEEVTQKHIDEGLVPGAVMLVARRGKVAWMSVLGKRDRRGGRCDEVRFDLPHLFHDQADRERRGHADGRGRQASGQRPGGEVPARDRQDEGRRREDRGRQAGAAARRSRPRHDGAGPAAPHLGPRLRLARHDPRQPGLYRRQDRRSRQHQCRVRRQALGAAVEVPARRALGIRRLGRRAGQAHRGDRRQDAGRGPERARPETARHGRLRASRCRPTRSPAPPSPGRGPMASR